MAGLPGSARHLRGPPGPSAALPAPDTAFLRSPLGALMGAEAVLGLLVWALIADTTYYLHAAYSWVLFVSIFFWIVTVLFFVTYLLQLQLKFHVIPWPLVLMIFNALATVLYVSAFVTCAAAVQPTSWRQWDYNRRAAAAVSSSVQGRAVVLGPLTPLTPTLLPGAAPLAVLCLPGNGRLRGQHLLQLPRLEGARQQRSHQPSDQPRLRS
ncbi:plasmolipin isoform X1 [Heliangelus exortis]|uniref:plasmolipin isoform X1 n=1 Tax=Heliangelus exortis TaxID=472823 RepID=UPI003A8CF1E9